MTTLRKLPTTRPRTASTRPASQRGARIVASSGIASAEVPATEDDHRTHEGRARVGQREGDHGRQGSSADREVVGRLILQVETFEVGEEVVDGLAGDPAGCRVRLPRGPEEFRREVAGDVDSRADERRDEGGGE